MNSVLDIRFVKLPNGNLILQFERSLWGGEAKEWVTASTREWEYLKNKEKNEIIDSVPSDTLGEV